MLLHRHHFFLLTLLFIVFTPLFFFSNSESFPASAATSDVEIYGWAWSENIGWISFSWKNCDTDNDGYLDRLCGGDGIQRTNTAAEDQYSVKIKALTNDTNASAVVYGKAFSPNIGFVSFGTENRGVNDNAGAPVDPSDNETRWAYFGKGGQVNKLKGWARACSVYSDPISCSGALKNLNERGGWDGWIKLSGKSTDGSSYGASRSAQNMPGYFQYNSFAWGGAGSGSTNPNEQFPGWIDFNPINDRGPFCGDGICNNGETYMTCLSDCRPPNPPGGGEYCGDGFCSSTNNENCFRCAQDCGSCGGRGMCPDGITPIPNSSGVYQGGIRACPLYAECYATVNGQRVDRVSGVVNIAETPSVKWIVNPSGATTYNILWPNNSTGRSLTTNYGPTDADRGTVSFNVSVKDGNQSSIQTTSLCSVRLVNRTATQPYSEYDYSLPDLKVEFGRPDPAKAMVKDRQTDIAPLVKIQQLNPNAIHCSARVNISIDGIRPISGNPVAMNSSTDYDYTPINNANLNYGSDFTRSLDLTLKNKSAWVSGGQYILKLKIETVGGSSSECNTVKYLEKPFRLGGGGGFIIEQ